MSQRHKPLQAVGDGQVRRDQDCIAESHENKQTRNTPVTRRPHGCTVEAGRVFVR